MNKHINKKKDQNKNTYWNNRKDKLTYNCTAILKQEEERGIPVFKQGNKLIKEITQGVNRGYIPQPYRGNKKLQTADGDI